MPRSIKKEFPHIFIDWHPTLNGKANPSALRRTSRKKYWWMCHNKKCGCNWKATIYSRIHAGDSCPKCAERKNKKFSADLIEIKKIFVQARKLSKEIDVHLEDFTNDDLTLAAKVKNSVLIRRKIAKMQKLGLEFRKALLLYKKKMIDYKIKKGKK